MHIRLRGAFLRRRTEAGDGPQLHRRPAPRGTADRRAPLSLARRSQSHSSYKHQTGARRVLRLHSQWSLATKSQINYLCQNTRRLSTTINVLVIDKHVQMTARDPSKRVQRGGKPPSLADSHPTTARPLHVARSHATEYHSHAKTAQTPRLPSPTPMAGGASCGCQLAVHVCCCPISNHLRPRNTGPGACRPGSPSAPASAARRPGPLLLLCRIPP